MQKLHIARSTKPVPYYSLDPMEWLTRKFGKRKAKQIAARIEAYFAWLKAQQESTE